MSRALAWLVRWGVSVASFVGGVLALLVFRRGLPHVAWIVGYLLLLWMIFAVLTQVRGALATSPRRSHRLVVTAADYTIQTLYHGLLLFVLPAYWASTTLTSVNVAFLVLVAALALVTTFDPWYRGLVLPRPWLGYVFFVVSIFAALNVALPLVGLPPFLALMASAFLAALALTPAVRRRGRISWGAAIRRGVAAGIVAATVAAVGRGAVPPAPIHLRHGYLAWGDEESELAPLPAEIPAAHARARGLLAYTAIYAPAGLTQAVDHVWRHRGAVVARVPLASIVGGRREGFRTWSRKTVFPADPTGGWTVDVVTASGQLIGRLRFRMIP